MWRDNNAGTGVIIMNAPTRPTAEIARLGKEIYERDIRSKLEDSHHGEYVAIDMETGDWTIADNRRGSVGAFAGAAPRRSRRVDGTRRIPRFAQLRGWVTAEDWVIEGVVNAAYEAVVSLSLQGAEGRTQEIEAVVDTGYTGFLTLPHALVDELGLPFAYVGRAFLANDY